MERSMNAATINLKDLDLRREAQQSTGQSKLAAGTALGILLLTSQYAAQNVSLARRTRVPVYDAGVASSQALDPLFHDSVDLARELLWFHDQLTQSQRELDERANDILRRHLWELYE
jgi:hypothetical protein